MGSGRAPYMHTPLEGRFSSGVAGRRRNGGVGTWRGLRPLQLRLGASLDMVEEYGGGTLKLLRNIIILRAVGRMFKRGRRV
jgi:hypothetical protein